MKALYKSTSVFPPFCSFSGLAALWLVRRSGIPCQAARQLAESDYWREQFQTISENVSVRNVLMHSAH